MNTHLEQYRVYQNDWSGFEVDYIHNVACTVLWGYVKDKVFVPPQPVSTPDLKNRITAAVETITPDLLSRVWQELDYRLDVCRVTSNICRYVS